MLLLFLMRDWFVCDLSIAIGVFPIFVCYLPWVLFTFDFDPMLHAKWSENKNRVNINRNLTIEIAMLDKECITYCVCVFRVYIDVYSVGGSTGANSYSSRYVRWLINPLELVGVCSQTRCRHDWALIVCVHMLTPKTKIKTRNPKHQHQHQSISKCGSNNQFI